MIFYTILLLTKELTSKSEKWNTGPSGLALIPTILKQLA